jgi:ribosomal-protein-serine acetyltransferase
LIASVAASQRILLRRFRGTDAEALYEAVDESRTDLRVWLDWADEHYSLSTAADWIAKGSNTAAMPPVIDFGVFSRNEDAYLLGVVGLSSIDYAGSVANLGYWIRSSQTRKGYAKEAVRILAQYAHSFLAIETVEIAVHPANTASAAVAIGAGCREIGLREERIVHKGKKVPALVFLA